MHTSLQWDATPTSSGVPSRNLAGFAVEDDHGGPPSAPPPPPPGAAIAEALMAAGVGVDPMPDSGNPLQVQQAAFLSGWGDSDEGENDEDDQGASQAYSIKRTFIEVQDPASNFAMQAKGVQSMPVMRGGGLKRDSREGRGLAADGLQEEQLASGDEDDMPLPAGPPPELAALGQGGAAWVTAGNANKNMSQPQTLTMKLGGDPASLAAGLNAGPSVGFANAPQTQPQAAAHQFPPQVQRRAQALQLTPMYVPTGQSQQGSNQNVMGVGASAAPVLPSNQACQQAQLQPQNQGFDAQSPQLAGLGGQASNHQLNQNPTLAALNAQLNQNALNQNALNQNALNQNALGRGQPVGAGANGLASSQAAHAAHAASLSQQLAAVQAALAAQTAGTAPGAGLGGLNNATLASLGLGGLGNSGLGGLGGLHGPHGGGLGAAGLGTAGGLGGLGANQGGLAGLGLDLGGTQLGAGQLGAGQLGGLNLGKYLGLAGSLGTVGLGTNLAGVGPTAHLGATPGLAGLNPSSSAAAAGGGNSNYTVSPLQQRQPEMSMGSATHGTGSCRPCAWFWKPQGCANGKDCRHCHLCDSSELKRRKKDKVATLRQQEES